MEWVDDAKACLSVAEDMLSEIQILIEESKVDTASIPFLKVKVKNFLENCRSPLDYAAYYVFDTYCKSEYTRKQRKKINVYFPIRNSKQDFDTLILEKFKNLSLKKPEIIEIFENAQSFTGTEWLRDLNRLINKNKHLHLTKQKMHRTSNVGQMQIGGITFTNLILAGNESDIVINGKPYNFGNPDIPESLNYMDAETVIDYKFSDLDKFIHPTLERILSETSQVINKMEQII